MIEQALHRWHRFVENGSSAELELLLAEEVVFYSPIVFTPQHGREITMLYLQSARVALAGGGAFTYTKQVVAGELAVLEFETTVDGRYVNGVDILRCDDSARIVEFRVMVRPLQAVEAVHHQMRDALAGQ